MNPHRNICGGRWILAVSLAVLIASIVLPVSAQPLRPDSANVEYATVDGKRLTLDVYLPKGAAKPYPVVVWIHGGAWMSGAKENPPATLLLASGYAVVSINYRLSKEGLFPAQLHDCKAAIRWVRASAATYNCNPNRIGVWGSSAGGHLAALLGTTGTEAALEGAVGQHVTVSSRVQAVCDWYGPSDLTNIAAYPSTIDRTTPTCPEAKLIGGSLQRNSERAWRASPVAYVTPDDPPFLIMHGTADNTVPFHQSVELDSVLRSAGVRVAFRPIKDAGHGGNAFNADSVRQVVRVFFDTHLKSSKKIRHDERF